MSVELALPTPRPAKVSRGLPAAARKAARESVISSIADYIGTTGTVASSEVARAGVAAELRRLGVTEHLARVLATTEAERPLPSMAGLGANARAAHNAGPYYRAAYLVRAAQRIQAATDDPARSGVAQLATERGRFLAAHQAAQLARERGALRLDAAADTWGDTLGWYAWDDDRTTPECAAASGKNFDPSDPPAIGLPGIGPHVGCRCYAGPAHEGAEMMGGHAAVHPVVPAEVAASETHSGSGVIDLKAGLMDSLFNQDASGPFNAAAHPRVPKGQPAGGKFVATGAPQQKKAAAQQRKQQRAQQGQQRKQAAAAKHAQVLAARGQRQAVTAQKRQTAAQKRALAAQIKSRKATVAGQKRATAATVKGQKAAAATAKRNTAAGVRAQKATVAGQKRQAAATTKAAKATVAGQKAAASTAKSAATATATGQKAAATLASKQTAAQTAAAKRVIAAAAAAARAKTAADKKTAAAALAAARAQVVAANKAAAAEKKAAAQAAAAARTQAAAAKKAAAQQAAAAKATAPKATKGTAASSAKPTVKATAPAVKVGGNAGVPAPLTSLGFAVDSMEKASTPDPIGKPGGPGLWHHKGKQLPAYIQHIAKALMKGGMDESRAIATAVNTVKRWAAGGGKVRPDTQAAARKALAEWEADKADTKLSVVALAGPHGPYRYSHGWKRLDDDGKATPAALYSAIGVPNRAMKDTAGLTQAVDPKPGDIVYGSGQTRLRGMVVVGKDGNRHRVEFSSETSARRRQGEHPGSVGKTLHGHELYEVPGGAPEPVPPPRDDTRRSPAAAPRKAPPAAPEQAPKGDTKPAGEMKAGDHVVLGPLAGKSVRAQGKEWTVKYISKAKTGQTMSGKRRAPAVDVTFEAPDGDMLRLTIPLEKTVVGLAVQTGSVPVRSAGDGPRTTGNSAAKGAFLVAMKRRKRRNGKVAHAAD